MTDVTYQRQDYKDALYRWRLVRDVCKGSESIKSERTRYLPQPNAQDESDENKARYDAYLARAVFYNATGRTKGSLVGAVFRTWPVVTLPKLLEYVTKDVDGQGVSIYQQSQSVIGHLLETGRHGLLVDYPPVEPGTVSQADMASGAIRPTVSSYPAEAIINWKTRKVGGRHVLSLVVLRETVDEDTEDGFGVESKDQYRVLRLNEAGQYQQELWRQAGVGWMVEDPRVPLDGSGKPWAVIPFQFVGSENNDTSIDESPLYDMAEINIGHYHNSADYEEAAYLVGQPQPWMSGLDEQWRDHFEETGIYLGSRAPWLLPVNGACGVWQAQPNTVAKEAMDAKERQMVALGARLIEKGSAVKTATQSEAETAAEHSALSLIVSNVSEAYTQCLMWMAQFLNVSGEIEYTLNQDFTQANLDPQMLQQILQAVMAGKMPESDFWRYLRDFQLIDPEKDDDAIREELASSGTGLNLEYDNGDGGATD
ncbi:DUF4055 domain-containing protein [Stutzerimonas nitrititolerans]|uniref:DUF4055 domain-containing protein n=1 Tax=Stutzerimonas nitrititolerans TaxID=2482751 RepID=UPI002898C7F8|nr:DUF4055 domain-containing protein [Stutzerimonas nitrititolerans]